MLRRDYILDQVEQFAAALAEILGFTKKGEWQNAVAASAHEFGRLTGMDPQRALELSRTQLLGRVLEGGPTQIAENKILMLAALFKANGDVLAGQGRTEESRRHYLRGLELLLDPWENSAIDQRPGFAPTVGGFVTVLGDSPLPAQTMVMLMRHYERGGEFARAEDMLFAVSETEPAGAELREFGAAFYQRLLNQSDAALAGGNLSRKEAREGLADFLAKMKAS